MTIRRTLITIFVALGVALCLSVVVQLRSSLAEYRNAIILTRSNLAREQIARGALAIYHERTQTYLSFLGAPGAEIKLRSVQQATDAVMTDSAEALDASKWGKGSTRLDDLQARLRDLRAVPVPTEGREAAASGIFAGYSTLVADLLSLRVSLWSQEPDTDPATDSLFRLRVYESLLLDDLSVSQAMLGGLWLQQDSTHRQAAVEMAERSAHRAEMAIGLLEVITTAAGPRIEQKIRSQVSFYQTVYHPTESAMLRESDSRSTRIAPDALWGEHAARMSDVAASLQESLFSTSRDRLAARRQTALLHLTSWSVLLLAGVAAVIVGSRVVLHRVVRPLEGLRSSMLALADGNLAATLPQPTRGDEIGVMADTLRVFKANAIRRARLQDERLALHERLKNAYQQLRTDLESAAAVQSALLPSPTRIGGVRFLGRLQPSNFISGDTYDVLRQPNGSVHFFVIDVAGHGAAAALVSVASHYTLTQAILRRQAGEGLAETVAGLNRDWPEHLPYFTMILGELRPEAGKGTLVQSGHPPPLLLRRSGGVEPVGAGGLPIGVLPGASFDELLFDFAPGDRLLIYSDGLTEAEDGAGQPFTEERLLDLVRSQASSRSETLLDTITGTLQRWRASETLDDDMTLLILEATDDEVDRGTAQ